MTQPVLNRFAEALASPAEWISYTVSEKGFIRIDMLKSSKTQDLCGYECEVLPDKIS